MITKEPFIPELPLVLASASPRRQQLLRDLGFNFEVIIKEVDEDYPPYLIKENVALFLADKKAASYDMEVASGKIVITADTIVCVDNEILGKPSDYNDCARMLRILSGRKHEVITAVCIRTPEYTDSFYSNTGVWFGPVSEEEISYYMNNFNVLDKAGAYGIQDWIGLALIEKIEGSYFNVVGLPVHELYRHLKNIASGYK
jgi:septum formation protein